MNVTNIVYIVILAFCAVGSGFFSGSETALIGIGRERVHQMATTGRRGKRVAQLVADPERLLDDARKIESGDQAAIRVAAPNQQVVGLPLSLKGFTKAISSIEP